MTMWTEQETKILKNFVLNKMPVGEIAEILLKSSGAVQQKIDKLSREERAEIGRGALSPEDAVFSNRPKKATPSLFTDDEKRLVISHTDFVEFYKEYRNTFPDSQRTVSALESFFSHRNKLKKIVELESMEETKKRNDTPHLNIEAEFSTRELYKRRASVIRRAILDLKLRDGDAIDINSVFKSIGHQLDGITSLSAFRAFLYGYGVYKSGEFRKDLDDIVSNHGGVLVFVNSVKTHNTANIKSDTLPDVGELLVKILHAMAESNQLAKESNASIQNLIKIQESTQALFTEIRNKKVATREIAQSVST